MGKVKRVNIKEDSKVTKYPRKFYKKYPQKLDESFAVLDSDFLGRGKGRGRETNLGRLISHSFCYITNSDVCFFNNGGLRVDLDKGSVTRRDIMSLMPFGNEICHLKLKTKDLVNYIEKIYKATKKRSTHYYGVNFEVFKDKILELSVNIEENIHSLEDNKSLRPIYSRGNILINKTFDIATTCFLSRGRDGYPNMEKLKTHGKFSLNDGIDYTDALVFIDFLKQKKKVKGKEYLKKTVILEK
jgi:2',3'-cyclic-nucleotide 2'-phosphodiesterase (5'-nucleotidase family)